MKNSLRLQQIKVSTSQRFKESRILLIKDKADQRFSGIQQARISADLEICDARNMRVKDSMNQGLLQYQTLLLLFCIAADHGCVAPFVADVVVDDVVAVAQDCFLSRVSCALLNCDQTVVHDSFCTL